MPLPHDQTTQLSAAVDAAADQLSAIARNVGEACEASASYLTRPQVDPDAEFDPAVYLGSLVKVGQSMMLATAAWVGTVFDNATLLSERVPYRWLSETFPLADIEAQRILDIAWGDESIDPANAQLVAVSDAEAQLSLVSLTAHVDEVTLVVAPKLDVLQTKLSPPQLFTLSMRADFDTTR